MRFRVVPCSWLSATFFAIAALAPLVVVVLSIALNPGVGAGLIVAVAFPFFGWMALRSVVLVGADWVRPGAWWEAKPVRCDEVREVLAEGFDLIVWMLDGRQVVVGSNVWIFDPGNERAIRRITRAIERRSKDSGPG